MYACMVCIMIVLYTYTGPPAMVPSVTIDVNTLNIDAYNNNSNVSFTLSWTEPFANFTPITNYTITINCINITNGTVCPLIITTTDNVTTSVNVNFTTDLSMMNNISVTASNDVGMSDPTTTELAGTYVAYIAIL